MITTDLVFLIPISGGRRGTLNPNGAAMTREEGEAYLARWPREAAILRLDRLITCGCCGARATVEWANGQARCNRHHDRNPCAIEGCRRTRAAPASGQLGDDQWLCGEHWRRFVPPRSARRRAYHAFFRRAKRHGWDDDLKRKFWRFWNSLVASARRRSTAGYLDEAAINRLFGWEGD